MKRLLLAFALVLSFSLAANAQFGKLKVNKKAVDAVSKGVQSFTLTDAELKGYADQATKWEDEHNHVCRTTDEYENTKAYAERLEKIVANVPQELIAQYDLDIKAYHVTDVNAFARPNGSIRIFTSLMDLMTDEQILAVIGHEIGHVVNKDSKDAFVAALRMSALKDAAGAAGGATVATLSDSDLGNLAESLGNAQFSQKQENAADDYGYEFLKKCGKDASNMASSLNVLLTLQVEAGAPENSKFNKLFSSHPDLKNRIERLNKKK
ncbi:M48 family metalloprotease [Dysgonomonas sp. 25]|uniref:M48 family metalloprotease n=1 Tax=Dysgonomonas sp. 25 TaxID=2302933 RepID=UPI0013D54945|nr:M48 family metalloprotease [Dysgonomonas sp. 25]NDV67591.1 peptidase [Dysgonomonas sp. 25]